MTQKLKGTVNTEKNHVVQKELAQLHDEGNKKRISFNYRN